MSTSENNRCRIDRMDIWISHAETASGDDDSHVSDPRTGGLSLGAWGGPRSRER